MVKHFANDTKKYKMKLIGHALLLFVTYRNRSSNLGFPAPAALCIWFANPVKHTHRRAKLHNDTITKAP